MPRPTLNDKPKPLSLRLYTLQLRYTPMKVLLEMREAASAADEQIVSGSLESQKMNAVKTEIARRVFLQGKGIPAGPLSERYQLDDEKDTQHIR